MKKYILASGSPRRRELIKKLNLDFEIMPSRYEEELDNRHFSYEKIEKLAYDKALEVANRLTEPAIIVGADTVVVLDKRILTKPIDRNDAFNTLKALSNREHEVVTGMAIIDKYQNKSIIRSVTTKVAFNNLTDEMINFYIDNYKPFDKAGSYGIQELPEGFVNYLVGNEENVIGLCTTALKEMLVQL